MLVAGGFLPQSVEVVVVGFAVLSAEFDDAVLLLLPGGPSLVAALAAGPRLGNGLFVQGRPAGLTNLTNRQNVKLQIFGIWSFLKYLNPEERAQTLGIRGEGL